MASEIQDAIIKLVAANGPTLLDQIYAWGVQQGIDVTQDVKDMLYTGVIYYVSKGTVVVNPKKVPGAPVQPNKWDRVKNEPWANRGQTQPKQQGGYRFYNLKI